jgi:nucleotide-binding universal stress UspA family protein
MDMKPKKTRTNRKPRILLAEDIQGDRRSEAMLAISAKLARRLGLAIDRVHVEDDTFYPVRGPQFAKMFEHYARERDAKWERGPAVPAPARSILLSGSPAAKLLALAGKRGAYEMMVVGTQGRSGVNRLLTGSVAEELIRRARIPVLTVGPRAQERSADFLPEGKTKILLPTSLTKNSERAEAYAGGLAKRLGAEIVLLYSLYDGLHPAIQTVYALPNPTAELAGLINELKKKALKTLGIKAHALRKKGVTASVLLDHGYHSAEQAILREAASTGASLLVMGTHGRSMLSGAFFGRTARGVILGAEIPVITVRSRTA